jgi:ABC-type antimicrobial peptide transport system permease subunit
MMTCSKNLFKHLIFFYQTKTNKKMSQHDFQFFENLVIFFSKKFIIKCSLFVFIFHICANFQTKEKKKCVFECFQSHCHILKELREFCV